MNKKQIVCTVIAIIAMLVIASNSNQTNIVYDQRGPYGNGFHYETVRDNGFIFIGWVLTGICWLFAIVAFKPSKPATTESQKAPIKETEEMPIETPAIGHERRDNSHADEDLSASAQEQKLEFRDEVIGALLDNTGLAFVVFTRISNPQSSHSMTELMAATPYNEIFVVEHASTESGRFIVTFANPDRILQCIPSDLVEVSEGQMAKAFVVAVNRHVALSRRPKGADVLDDFWKKLDRVKLAAWICTAGKETSSRVKPISKGTSGEAPLPVWP